MKRIETDEKRRYKILVQRIDIKALAELNIMAPSSIFYNFLVGDSITEENQYDFVEFIEEEEIQFFLDQDWILDYDQYNQFSSVELEIAKQVFFQDLSNLQINLFHTPLEEISQRRELKKEIQKKRKEYEAILYLLFQKEKKDSNHKKK